MKRKTTRILALMLLVPLAGAGTLYRKLAAKQVSLQLQAEAESITVAESPAAEGQDSIASKVGAKSAMEESNEALTAAPDLTVQEADDIVRKFSEYKGKPVALNPWASWYGPCRVEMSEFNEVYKEHSTGVQFLMVNLADSDRETVKNASDFVTAQGYSLPILHDAAQNAAKTYGALSIPCIYFVDANSMMTAQARSVIDKDALLHGTEMITTK